MASGFEGCDDLPCEFSGVGVFEEGAVWGAFAFGLDAVAVVDEDFHVVEGDSSSIPSEIPGQAGDDEAKVRKSGNSVMELPREIVS